MLEAGKLLHSVLPSVRSSPGQHQPPTYHLNAAIEKVVLGDRLDFPLKARGQPKGDDSTEGSVAP